jgi:hypothetical protein
MSAPTRPRLTADRDSSAPIAKALGDCEEQLEAAKAELDALREEIASLKAENEKLKMASDFLEGAMEGRRLADADETPAQPTEAPCPHCGGSGPLHHCKGSMADYFAGAAPPSPALTPKFGPLRVEIDDTWYSGEPTVSVHRRASHPFIYSADEASHCYVFPSELDAFIEALIETRDRLRALPSEAAEKPQP